MPELSCCCVFFFFVPPIIFLVLIVFPFARFPFRGCTGSERADTNDWERVSVEFGRRAVDVRTRSGGQFATVPYGRYTRALLHPTDVRVCRVDAGEDGGVVLKVASLSCLLWGGLVFCSFSFFRWLAQQQRTIHSITHTTPTHSHTHTHTHAKQAADSYERDLIALTTFGFAQTREHRFDEFLKSIRSRHRGSSSRRR